MTEASDLQSRLEALFDDLYANAPVRTPTAIWHEVNKILQTGVFLEHQLDIAPAFSFSRSEQARLARFEAPITMEVASWVRKQHSDMSRHFTNSTSDNQILLLDENIATVCRALSGITLSPLHGDVIGDALEVFRHNWTKRNGGQFFTDSAITRLAIELLEYDPHQGHDLVDLAAGTGGFLLAAANHIKSKSFQTTLEPNHRDSELAILVKNSIKGVEIDQSLAELANMTIGARIADFDFRPVTVCDSLDPKYFQQLSQFGIRESGHLRAATNPPFGSKINVRNPSVLVNYETAHIRNQSGTPSPTSLDILFLERNLSILRPGDGLLAIVLPYQLTSGPQARGVRHWLLKHAELKVVVDLPNETFQPYTGTKTCLVVLRRRITPLEDLSYVDDGPIFMSVPRWVGHDRRGKPVYATLPDGSPSNEVLSDINEVARAFQLFRNGETPETVHSESFVIPANQVLHDPQLRFNARFFQPNKLLQTVSIVSQSSTWKSVKLGSLANRIFFPGRFKRRYVSQSVDAVPFLGGTNISQYIPVIEKWLSKNDPLVEKLQVFPDWLLVTRSGSTGIVTLVPDHWTGWTVSEHVIRIIPNDELIHPSYLEAYLRTNFAKASIQRGVFGSVIDEITPEFLSEIEILVPESKELMNHIILEAQLAKQARNNAIESITRAINMIEESVIHLSN